jgi:acetyl-CoA carboxylase biotin carboxylase subunit
MRVSTEMHKSFKKVLVANRGEIALRIIRALHEMNIGSVAVYSDADRDALHVRRADEAYRIGPPPPRESYLRVDKIIETAAACGAEAIHPGYGFLAENHEFAAACRDAGIVFIGPTEENILRMGDKLTAREVARKAGVPVVPGTRNPVSDPAEAAAKADEIGYPVLLKAAAGGGGKGMRVVGGPGDLDSALSLTMGEARTAFGDERVYLEKYLVEPRHIEVQILGDGKGHAVHLMERECSIQRRHQKLLEETPSPALTEEDRREICGDAVRLTEEGRYLGAGTVEFMFDSGGNHYFLEMNTRLQVEHPVTEMVTGIDLVKEQIRIATHGEIARNQEDIEPRGAAIECRICAEDPFNSFYPSTGTITRLRTPQGPGMRNDIGVYVGAEISLFYDSLMGKLIAWGKDREEARLRMTQGLEEYIIEGIRHNLPFHRWLVACEPFVEGRMDTGFIDKHFRPELAEDERVSVQQAAAIAAAIEAVEDRARLTPPGESGGRPLSAWRTAGIKTPGR